jgi:DNA mismatch repair protein MutS
LITSALKKVNYLSINPTNYTPMQFEMDTQTFEDLEIFSTKNGKRSIFSLFKITKTTGGRHRMEEIMRTPGTDLGLLTDRIDTIKYFKESGLEIDINNNQLDLIEYYINYAKGHLKHNPIDSLAAYLGNKIKSNVHYYTVGLGLQHLLTLLRYSAKLISELDNKEAPAYLKRTSKSLENILELDIVKYALTIRNFKKLNFHQTSKLDVFFRRKGKDIAKQLLAIFYELDVFETVAYAATQNGFSLPAYLDTAEIALEIQGLRHPAIAKAIENDIELNKAGNLIFLSGSNMAGKSSLLKSIGITIYLAHIGFPVPATSMKTCIFHGLVSSINLSDQTQNGLSHYYSEVMRIKETASLLNGRDKMFIMFDELFRGTNVKDAYEASLLVISELAKIRTSIFIISTHIVELAQELEKIKNISFRYMETQFIEGKYQFTYRLQNGVSTDRLGMYILQNEGIVDLIRQASK